MKNKEPGSWDASTGLARAILHDRTERRKWMGRMVLVPLGMLAVGLWVIDAWIWESPWRVLFWWGGCAVATVMVMLFAMYDALAVIREEREKHKDS
ncbi:hypothetical protein JIN84_19305 [Luteolibacter yonseiensis]|uniref:Uncharacterized protein n=1 Tax=Luteolibacter yonseiensis TaxID=1144680 RepID=A0A934VD87_9BACT|nr:hypothetical protein [Luteolibacter yonseiensis]MBK1817776.1 hypothetical protein [Luteolibacter yonseiensis]